jgi:hypothetical protein
LAADAVDAVEAAIVTDAAGEMATVPSCVTCQAGYSLVTRSVRGRPPMGRCGESSSVT